MYNNSVYRDSSAESDSDTDTDKSSTDYLSDTMPDSDHFDANKSVDPNCLLSKAGAPFDKEGMLSHTILCMYVCACTYFCCPL